MAAIAMTTVACSLVASLGDDYTTAKDAAAGDGSVPEGSVRDGGSDGAGEGGGPGAEGGGDAGCVGAGIDPAFRNGRVTGLPTAVDGGLLFLSGITLGPSSLESIVTGVLRTDGVDPGPLYVTSFAADGTFTAANAAVQLATGTSGIWTGNGSTFAALLGAPGAPPTLWLLRSTGDGTPATLATSGPVVESVVIDQQYVYTAAADRDASDIVLTRYFLDGGMDPSETTSGTAVQTDFNHQSTVRAVEVRSNVSGVLLASGEGVGGYAVDVTHYETGSDVLDVTTLPVDSNKLSPLFDLVPTPDQSGAFFLTQDSPDASPGAVKLDTDGGSLASYGDGGVAAISLPGFSLQAAVADSQGRLWLLGVVDDDLGYPTIGAVARLTPGGQLDPSWNAGGVIEVPFDANITIAGGVMTLQNQLVVGFNVGASTSVAASPALVRFCP